MKTLKSEETKIDLEAADWLLRWDDDSNPVTAKEQARWMAWLNRSPAHVKAFFHLSDTYTSLEGLDRGHTIDIDGWLRARSITPLRIVAAGFDSSVHHATTPPRRIYRWLSAAAIAGLIAGLSLFAGRYWQDHRSYATVIGGQRRVELPDGSTMTLNTQSRAVLSFDRQQRSVALFGEALFSVARDSSRPFLVNTSNAVTRAIGTRFNVNTAASGGRTEVTVLQGIVQVTALAGSAQAQSPSSGRTSSITLAAGEQAQVGNAGASKRSVPNVMAKIAWEQHVLVFEGTPLSSVANEFSRYNKLRFRIDPAVGDAIRLSGTFDALYPQSLVLFLHDRKDLRINQEGDEITVEAQDAHPADQSRRARSTGS